MFYRCNRFGQHQVGDPYRSKVSAGLELGIHWSDVVVRGRGRTADLPLFRIKDHPAGPATEVSLAAQGPAVHADRRRCTCMYETRNETAHLRRGPAMLHTLSSSLGQRRAGP
jgi:hypothetical protein